VRLVFTIAYGCEAADEWLGKSLPGHPMDFESKSERKPVAHNRCGKREVVATGNQMVGSYSHNCIASNLRAIGVFPYFPDGLPNCAQQPHPAYVRNIVSGHFVAFIGRRKEKPSPKRGLSEEGAPYSTSAITFNVRR
jgi:hypothetical protein